MTRILVIGDAHAHPKYDNDRFEHAGAQAREANVDLVVSTGDWFDFASLCKHATRKEREGMRVRAEVEAGHDALRRFHKGLGARKGSKPALLFVEGNHDVRPDAMAADDPALEGAVAGDRYAPFQALGWKLVRFRETATVAGILWSHYQAAGTMGRPVGGKSGAHLAGNLVSKCHAPTVVGHDHRFGVAWDTRPDGKKTWAASAGCFVHPKYTESWCRQTRPMWDVGLLLLDVEKGHLRGHAWTTYTP